MRRKQEGRGLTAKERQKERSLRKKIAIIRRDIKTNGTWPENHLGYTDIIYNTIEWFLVYHIRGQNEGINGIIKKRDALIGDGQKTTWYRGKKNICNKIDSILCMYKYIALVHTELTGNIRNGLCRIHNWKRQRVFLVIFLVEKVVKPPL